MKTVFELKILARAILLGAVLALGFANTAGATWNENSVTGDMAAVQPAFRHGVYDPGYGVYWCIGTNNNLYAVYWSGTAWTSKSWATNAADDQNVLALDTNYHWVFYRGTDGYVWICYYTGSTWTTAKVGSNLNNCRQLCCDSGYHVLWYVNGTTGYLWALYYNGSAWVETLIDGVNQRYSQGRCCGVDEVYHFVWHMAADRRSLRYTYHNGSAWTSASPGTLPGTDLYQSICADGPTHQIYNYQMTAAFAPTKMQSLYWTGSAWSSWTCIKDGHLATTSSNLFCLPAQTSYSCYVADVSVSSHVVFTTYSANARNWCSCRQDTSGYYPLASGHGGRSILCYSATGPKLIYSDLP